MDNRSYILRCIALIEQKVDWGKTPDWVDYDFKNLSDQIFESTKVSISVRTLKRIIRQIPDAEGYYEPQMATKNALAVYLGFRNWADFKRSDINETEEKPEQYIPSNTPNLVKPFGILKWLVPSLIVISGISVYFVWKFQHSAAELTIKKIAVNNIAIKYDLKARRYNNATIDLDYGFFRPLVTPKGEFSYFFKLPDNYRLKLLADGVVLAAQNVQVESNGWKCVVQQGQKEVLVGDTTMYHYNGTFSFRSERLSNIGLDLSEDYWTDYRNIKDFNIDGDNLIIELDIKNDPGTGGIDCFDSSVEYLGELKTGRVKFVKPNCSQFASFDFGEIHYNGNFHNLNSLAIDLSRWRKVRIEVINKRVNVLIDGKSVYQNKYTEPIGKVKGIKCKFKGPGAINNFRLLNLNQEVVYETPAEG